ncbi:uncharacterized protein LY79DRAFT_539004 [Colletotrichum navitas]|uniref:Uncharacterized protein n=1 Tax=Colletotrichum navitas TaxID=681940 RepID=A0AAD8QA17_9PEZI|nr:uncharacterized protein LY79DRAFT_539004 [Colletotrichum navitas]KAK1598374.1 hypothetical protein LY79DRAFT_539004 [Colletotrichum navitas]
MPVCLPSTPFIIIAKPRPSVSSPAFCLHPPPSSRIPMLHVLRQRRMPPMPIEDSLYLVWHSPTDYYSDKFVDSQPIARYPCLYPAGYLCCLEPSAREGRGSRSCPEPSAWSTSSSLLVGWT